MKSFVNPEFDLVKFQIEDVIATSTETPTNPGDGGGWA